MRAIDVGMLTRGAHRLDSGPSPPAQVDDARTDRAIGRSF